MITATLIVLMFSAGRAVSWWRAMQCESDETLRTKAKLEMLGHTVSSATCAIVLVWGLIFGVFGLP